MSTGGDDFAGFAGFARFAGFATFFAGFVFGAAFFAGALVAFFVETDLRLVVFFFAIVESRARV